MSPEGRLRGQPHLHRQLLVLQAPGVHKGCGPSSREGQLLLWAPPHGGPETRSLERPAGSLPPHPDRGTRALDRVPVGQGVWQSPVRGWGLRRGRGFAPQKKAPRGHCTGRQGSGQPPGTGPHPNPGGMGQLGSEDLPEGALQNRVPEQTPQGKDTCPPLWAPAGIQQRRLTALGHQPLSTTSEGRSGPLLSNTSLSYFSAFE